jgi:hypothetical protein
MRKVFLSNGIVVAMSDVGSADADVTYEGADNHNFVTDETMAIRVGDTVANGVYTTPSAPAESSESIQMRLAANVEALWRAADKYTASYISGVAIGLLTIGVIQGKPKALAVTRWSSSVWDDYYARKALVTADAPANLDFSALGPMPYTVPELRAELGM